MTKNYEMPLETKGLVPDPQLRRWRRLNNRVIYRNRGALLELLSQ